MANRSNDNGFVQEYLYVEVYPLDIINKHYSGSIQKSDEPKRGVVVIDLLGNEENAEKI